MNIFKKTNLLETFDKYTLEQRMIYSETLVNKYPDRIPVIIKKGNNVNTNSFQEKYLMPKSLHISEVLGIIRKKINITDKQAIFIFVKNNLVPMNMTIGDVYDFYKSEDNFLYIIYNTENTFG